jgi:DNA mismatch endonuclease (patch repair protein)
MTSRSDIMRAVRSKDTAPERAIRALLRTFAPGYRLHRADLPGTPDIVYVRRKRVIFVHGCFWHGHDCVRGARMPKTNIEYWTRKIGGNRARHERHRRDLVDQGWQVLTVWECELRTLPELDRKLRMFLEDDARLSCPS